MFFGKQAMINYDTKTSLRWICNVSHSQHDESPSHLNVKKRIQRTSCFSSGTWKASMCIEAAFSFSFFLFFLANIFSILFWFQSYARQLEALQQRGKVLSVAAYSLLPGEKDSEDILALMNMEKAESPFPVFALPDSRILAQCYVKAWTGYDVTHTSDREKEEEIVYVTEYGEVYHRSRSCTHLALSVEIADYKNIGSRRNAGGERYYPCEFCHPEEFSSVVFITRQGNRYHSGLSCSSLKRTIRAVRLWEIPGVPACQKCG